MDAIEQYVHSLIGDVLEQYDYKLKVTHEPNFKVVYHDETTRRAFKVPLTLRSFFSCFVRSLYSSDYKLNPNLYELHKFSAESNVDYHPSEVDTILALPQQEMVEPVTIIQKKIGFGLVDNGEYKYVKKSTNKYTVDMGSYKTDSFEVTHTPDICKIHGAIKENVAEVKRLLISQYTQLDKHRM